MEILSIRAQAPKIQRMMMVWQQAKRISIMIAYCIPPARGWFPLNPQPHPPNKNLKPIFECHPASRRVRGSRRNRNPPFLNPRESVVRGHRVVVAGVVATHLDTAGCRSFSLCRSFTHSRSLRSRCLDRRLLSQILNPQRSRPLVAQLSWSSSEYAQLRRSAGR